MTPDHLSHLHTAVVSAARQRGAIAVRLAKEAGIDAVRYQIGRKQIIFTAMEVLMHSGPLGDLVAEKIKEVSP